MVKQGLKDRELHENISGQSFRVNLKMTNDCLYGGVFNTAPIIRGILKPFITEVFK